jgi:hypothetical protein
MRMARVVARVVAMVRGRRGRREAVARLEKAVNDVRCRRDRVKA